MASTQKPEQPDDLNDSWVDLDGAGSQSGDPIVIHHGNLEKLLIEAQRESCTPSCSTSKDNSARGSPKSPHSPPSEWASEFRLKQVDPGTDWIWDWSSGPEMQPSGDWNGKFRHPTLKGSRKGLSVRHSKVMKEGVFRLENLPSLLLTHACTFFMGAAMMFFYLKKYCHWGTVAPPTLD